MALWEVVAALVGAVVWLRPEPPQPALVPPLDRPAAVDQAGAAVDDAGLVMAVWREFLASPAG